MRQRRVGWILVAGVMVGWLVAPRVADAVGNLVTIQSTSGTKAGVTKAQQLETAEAAPSTFREFRALGGSPGCHPVATIPAKKGFVIRTIVVDVSDESTGGLDAVLLFPNGSCSGTELFSASTRLPGVSSTNLEPGFALAASGKLSMFLASPGTAEVFVLGYLVPKGDVPSTTAVG
jgi:hypothetical protein